MVERSLTVFFVLDVQNVKQQLPKGDVNVTPALQQYMLLSRIESWDINNTFIIL